jgi:hypothetical protein
MATQRDAVTPHPIDTLLRWVPDKIRQWVEIL